VLGFAREQRVLILHRYEVRSVTRGDSGLIELRHCEIGASDLTDFSCFDQLVQCTDRVGNGHGVVGEVELVEINVVGTEASQ
jgi:hypothetical protein